MSQNLRQTCFSCWRGLNQAPICCCCQSKCQNSQGTGNTASSAYAIPRLNVDQTSSWPTESRNLEFEQLPEFLTEIPLDDGHGLSYSETASRPSNVITSEPYASSQLEVTTVPNDVLFPEDMFERWPQIKMSRHDLRYFDSLGQGWFGWIVRGRVRKTEAGGSFEKSKDQPVIVAMLKEEANVDEKRTFLEETHFAARYSFVPEDTLNLGRITKRDGSENVVRLIGICLETPPFLAIYEECHQGDLKTFLLNSRETLLANENCSGLMLRFCRNVTSGINFLHEVDCIPYDLAARCCQVTSALEVKIGDYGLAQYMYPNDYLKIQRFDLDDVRDGEDKLPLRWLPPEILAHLCNKNYDMRERLRKLPKPCSIWTLGVTLWEIATFGETPFAYIYNDQFQRNVDMEDLLKDSNTAGPGTILNKGYGTDSIESMVRLCTATDPSKRPTSQRLIAYIDAISESRAKMAD